MIRSTMSSLVKNISVAGSSIRVLETENLGKNSKDVIIQQAS